MRIHLLELEKLKGLAKEITFTFSFPEIMEQNQQVLQISPIQFSGEARHEAGVFRVEGTLAFQANLSCSRCLTHYQDSFTVPFEELFAFERTKPQEETEESLDTHWTNEDSVDLLPYLKEAITLALPYVPLCDSECKGLCPVCGKNQNEEECSCTVEHIDPRLADLAKLFNQEK